MAPLQVQRPASHCGSPLAEELGLGGSRARGCSPRLWSTGSAAVAHGLSCPAACGVFLRQQLNLRVSCVAGEFLAPRPPGRSQSSPSSACLPALPALLWKPDDSSRPRPRRFLTPPAMRSSLRKCESDSSQWQLSVDLLASPYLNNNRTHTLSNYFWPQRRKC